MNASNQRACENFASTPVLRKGPGSMRPGGWSDEEVRKLIDMWSSASNAEIAKALDRNENAVAIKASRLKLPRKEIAAKMTRAPQVKNGCKIRNCLTCRTPFYSEGAHNRICDPCKSSQDTYDTDYLVQVGGFY